MAAKQGWVGVGGTSADMHGWPGVRQLAKYDNFSASLFLPYLIYLRSLSMDS